MTTENRLKKIGRLTSLHSMIDVAAVLLIGLVGVVFRRELSEQVAFYWPTLATILQYLAVSISFRTTVSAWRRAIAASFLLTIGFAVAIFPVRDLFAPGATDLFLILYLLFAFVFFVPCFWLCYFMFGRFVRSAKQSFEKAGK